MINPATGFATAWLNWVATLASEFTASGMLMQRWFPDVPVWVFCLVFAAVIFIINSISSRACGEAEFSARAPNCRLPINRSRPLRRRNCGDLSGRGGPNVIPDTARLGISLRTSDSGDREYIKRWLEEIVSGICAAHRASSTLEWQEGYAAVINDEACAQLAFAAASKVLKPEDVGWGPAMSASEDFSAYSNKIPGRFIFLGGGDELPGYPYQNHHPKFDINESALEAGVKAEVQIALDYLYSDR